MKRFIAVCFGILMLAAGCARDPITVNGEGIPKEVFDYALKERLSTHKSLNLKVDEKAIKKSVADELVAEALLVQEAKSRKIVVTDDEVQKTAAQMRGGKSETDFSNDMKKAGIPYELFLKRLKERLLISRLMTGLVKDDSVAEEEMKEYYNKSQVPFLKPERDFVKILQLNTEADAKEAVEKLKKGEDFDALADGLAKSGKASAPNYGWLEPDVLSGEIASAMKSARLNVVEGPFKGKDGSYYLFKIKERQASQVLPYEEAKPQIRAALLNQKRQALAAQLVENRKKTAKIKMNFA